MSVRARQYKPVLTSDTKTHRRNQKDIPQTNTHFIADYNTQETTVTDNWILVVHSSGHVHNSHMKYKSPCVSVLLSTPILAPCVSMQRRLSVLDDSDFDFLCSWVNISCVPSVMQLVSIRITRRAILIIAAKLFTVLAHSSTTRDTGET